MLILRYVNGRIHEKISQSLGILNSESQHFAAVLCDHNRTKYSVHATDTHIHISDYFAIFDDAKFWRFCALDADVLE